MTDTAFNRYFAALVLLLFFILGMLVCSKDSEAQSYPVAPIPKQQFFDPSSNDAPLSGGLIYTYAAGTTSALATYTDSGAANTNPIVLDANGFPTVSGTATSIRLGPQAYKFVFANSQNVVLYTVDNVSSTNFPLVSVFSFIAQSAPSCNSNNYLEWGDVSAQRIKMCNNGTIDAIVGQNTIDTLINKTLTAPIINNPTISGIVYGSTSQSIYQMVQSLPPTGGMIILPCGTFRSGFENVHTGVPGQHILTQPNITIVGCGMPQYSSDFSHMVNGTIIQGTFLISSGANNLKLENLGVDVGATFVNANYGTGNADEGLAIFNNGQVVGQAPVTGVRIDNVSCLGYNATVAFHCMLIENVDGAMISNTQSVYNSIGGVLKGSHSSWVGHYSRGHSSLAFTVKSDNYALSSADTIAHIRVQSIVSGDTGNVTIDSGSASIADISFSDLTWNSNGNGAGFGLTSDSSNTLNNITVNNLSFNSDGNGYYCLFNSGSGIITNATINNVSCVGWLQPFAFAGSTMQKSTLSNFTGATFTNAATACGVEFKMSNLQIYNVTNGTALSCAVNGSLVYLNGLRTNAATRYTASGGAAIFPTAEPEQGYIDSSGTYQIIPPTVINNTLKVTTGIANGTGIQYMHTGATTATAASVGAVATTTFTWPNTWADTNYDVVCNGDNVAGTGTGVLAILGPTAKTTTTFTIATAALTAAAASDPNLDCLGWHRN